MDLHIHSNFSDGTEDVETIIEKIKISGINLFALTDHDTCEGCRFIFNNEKLKENLKKLKIDFVTGAEWSCDYNGLRMHILSYDIDPFDEKILSLEKSIRAILDQKDAYRIEGLKKLGFELSEKSLKMLAEKENSRSLDFANCLVNDGYFDSLQDAFSGGLNKIKYPFKTKLDAVETIKKLKECGAIVVWAHPIYDSKKIVLSYEKVEQVIQELKPLGLDGIECNYVLYSSDEIKKLKEIADKFDLVYTCGSDYHGKNKGVDLIEQKDNNTEIMKLFKRSLRNK